MSIDPSSGTGTLDHDDSPGIVETVRRTTLPDRIVDLVDDYEAVCGDRDRFLWRWIYSLFPSFTLSSVDAEHREHVRTQKTILTMYVTVLDDLVESRRDHRTFAEARRLAEDSIAPDPTRTGVDGELIALVEDLWTAFETGIADAPRAGLYADVFTYDLKQTTNAMEYSAVLDENPAISNLEGTERYDAHNMAMFAYADVDLMYSSGFDRADLGDVRALLWDLQELARIGNWVTTWEREIREGDYTAGVVVLALEEGVVTPTELADDPETAIVKIGEGDLESRFHERWREGYRAVRDRTFETDSVDLAALVEGMETVFEYHLATRGYK